MLKLCLSSFTGFSFICTAAPAPAVSGDSALAAGSPAASTDAQGPASGSTAGPMQSAAGAPADSLAGMPIPQPEAMLGPDIMALVNDVISPSAADAFAQVPEASPATPVDTLTSDSDSPPAEPETPAAEAGSDTSGGGAVPAEAPQGGDALADGELTAYQALLSGAYLRDLVSMQTKEHSTFAWVSVCKWQLSASLPVPGPAHPGFECTTTLANVL